MYFESGQLSPEQHKLVVTFLGNNNTQPLFLNYFVVQVQQDAPSSTATPSNTPSTVPPGKPNTDAIIGGVIGGLVLVSLLIALLFFFRKHNSRR